MSAIPDDKPAPSEAHSALFPVLICDALVLLVYVWLASVGTWTQWPTHWQLYDQLATSFRHEQLALDTPPDPALLALQDPYDPAARRGITVPQDVSFYHGRFYLYFGPVPALLLVPIKSFVTAPVGDQYVGFAFISGIFLLQSYFIAAIRRLYFPASPAWPVALLTLAAGLMNPWGWLISTPSIYNAAVTGGQFFLLAGLCLAFSAMRKTPVSVGRLALAGMLWAAALGSRINLLLPIALLSALITITLALEYRRAGATGRIWRPVVVLGSTLGVALLGLAWYNWARFGSPLEVGYRYQMGGVFKQAHTAELFSARYIVQNLYTYLLNAPALRYVFPYFSPRDGVTRSLVSFISLPAIYHTQEISGLLYSAPFLPLAVLPLAGRFLKRPASLFAQNDAPRFRWLVIALGGTFLLTFALFTAYYWVGERFIADFMPALFLLSALGFFQFDRWLTSRPVLHLIYRILFAVLVLASIVLGLSMAISFNSDGFRHLNPVLWRQLSNLFRP